MRSINCGFRSLKGKASIVNPVKKLYSPAYKVQQTLYYVLAKKKHELDEQHERACCLKVIIVIETYFI